MSCCCVLLVAHLLYRLVRAGKGRAKARAWSQVARRRRQHREELASIALACFDGTMTLSAEQERYISRLPAHAIAEGAAWEGKTLPAEAILAVFVRRTHVSVCFCVVACVRLQSPTVVGYLGIRRFVLTLASSPSLFPVPPNTQHIGHHALNCVTETLFEQACHQVKTLDKQASTSTRTRTSTTTTDNPNPPSPAPASTRRSLRLLPTRRKKSAPSYPSPSPTTRAAATVVTAGAVGAELPTPSPLLSPPAPPAQANRHAPGSKRRLLEGVPISLKENYEVKGTDATCGIASRCFQPSPEDGLLVQLLKEAGGIPFVKTNVPQALISFETTNNIYGTSLNAWNKLRTPGGSTGGESGLLAARASPLG